MGGGVVVERGMRIRNYAGKRNACGNSGIGTFHSRGRKTIGSGIGSKTKRGWGAGWGV